MLAKVTTELFQPMHWHGDHLMLLDQRLLPHQENWLRLQNIEQVAQAIQKLVVRGAPAIGITAAYGAVLAARQRLSEKRDDWYRRWQADCQLLSAARPTAVNLDWALRRLMALELQPAQALQQLESAAVAIHQQDIACNRRLAEAGSALLQPGVRIQTHCNTGPLATGAVGTALGVIITAHEQGKVDKVYVDETRPWLQGSRLSMWELQRAGVDCEVLIDSAGAWLQKTQRIDWLIVGADRVAANGDVANKIGTYQMMLAARHHGVKTMVVIPWSSLDMHTASGDSIPIEVRDDSEVLSVAGQRIAAANSVAWNPVFDVTPAALVDFLVTERGVIEQPDAIKIRQLADS